MDQPSGTPRFERYLSELRLSLRNNAGAYGYSVMITCCLATVSSSEGQPKTHEVFLFLFGAVASFAMIEAAATYGFRRPLHEKESTQVVALGSAMSLVSIALALAVAMVISHLTDEWLSWLLASFGASVVYLVMSSVEMAVARRIEASRGLS